MEHDPKGMTRRDLLERGMILGATASVLAVKALAQEGPKPVDLLVKGPDIVSYDDAGFSRAATLAASSARVATPSLVKT